MTAREDGAGPRRVEFFCPMVPPKVTAQAKVAARGRVFDSARLAEARAKLEAAFSRFAPERPLEGPVRLEVWILFPATERHPHGEPCAVKPDWDNAVKAPQDCLQRLGFLRDDSQVADGRVVKAFSDTPGYYVRAEEIDAGGGGRS